MSKFITGAGGASSGNTSSRAAVEDPDSLASKSYAKVIDLLGEGEWEQVCIGGLKGVYLNGVVAQNQDGTNNFEGITLETRSGSLGQTRMTIADTTEASFPVSVELTYNNPIEQIVYGESVDYIKVIIGLASLQYSDQTTGDIKGTSVEYKIEYKSNDNPTWKLVTKKDPAVTTAPLTFGSGPWTNYDRYSVGFTVNPARYFISDVDGGGEVQRPCVYELQVQTNSGSWLTIATGSVSSVFSDTYIHECLPTDSINFRVVVTNSEYVPAGSLLQDSYAQILEPSGGKYDYGTGIQKISGKTTSAYEREHAFRVVGESPFTVRVTRLTPDSTSNYLQNKTTFQSVSVVTEEKFRYPGSVLVGMSVDATQFSSIPTRAYDCKMLRVKVPNNYDPITRTYAGFWNGGFKIAWTDNPAWCFYDLITNKRYGLGERIPESYVDKAALYQIAQYCDEYVPDGNGGFEPRFTCNVYINNQSEAYRVVSDMATVFRGITYWASGNIVPVQDSPKEPVYAFNNTNVVDGMFTYQSSDVNTRYNAVSVTYNDPSNFYRQSTEYVADDDAIADLGYLNHTTVVAFGCTSKSMARRVGKWFLYTNTFETDAVNFTAGIEGAIPRPGDIIKISDSLRASERRGGRVKSATLSEVVLDAEMTFIDGLEYVITVLDDTGAMVDRTFTLSGETDTIPISPAYTNAVAKDSVFIIADTNIEPELFRVVGISEGVDFKYDISAVSYNPSKYEAIEKDERLTFASLPTTYVGAVTDVISTEILYSDGVSIKSKVRLDWKAPSKAVTYDVYVIAPDGERFGASKQRSTSFEVTDTVVGEYAITVYANDVLGHQSQGYTETIRVYGKTAPPADITGLSVKSYNGGGVVVWDSHPDLDVQVGGNIVIKYTPKTAGVVWEDGIVVATAPGSATQAVVPLLAGTYTAKAVDEGGKYGLGLATAPSSFAEVMNTNVMATLQESPTFSGVKTNLEVGGGILTLLPEAKWDSIVSVDDVPDVDNLTGAVLSGTYYFSDVIDLTDKYTVRAYGEISGFAAVIADTINSRLQPLNTWTRFNGDVINSATLKLFVATTDDDPYNVSAVWVDWEEFAMADYTARGFKFKVEMAVESAEHALYVTDLSVSLDAVDRVLGDDNVSVSSAGLSIVFDGAFATTPAIAISIDNMQNGDYYRLTSKSATGFTATIYDSSDTPVARQIDWVAKGYGRKV